MTSIFDYTVILSPTAKALIQVECGFAIPKLHIRKPFRYDIQKRRVDSNGRTCFP
jgi:hypothetical protein